MAKTTRSTSRKTKTAKGKATRAKPRTASNARTASRRPAKRADGATVTLREKDQPKDEANLLGGLPFRTLTPQLVIDGAAEAIEWYTKAFGAKELDRKPGPDGRILHAVVRIGDAAFMVSDSFGSAPGELNGAFIHIQDKGIDGMWQRAVDDGATPVLPLANQFWGDRYGQLRDPFGQLWSFGWPAKMTQAEKDRLQREAMAQMSTRADRSLPTGEP